MDVQYFILKTFYVAVFNFLLFHKKKKCQEHFHINVFLCTYQNFFLKIFFRRGIPGTENVKTCNTSFIL